LLINSTLAIPIGYPGFPKWQGAAGDRWGAAAVSGLGATAEKETVGCSRRLQRDGYRFGTDDLLARLNDGVHWLGVTRDGLREVIARVSSIGYVVDNAGEFQFDKALIKRLAELGRGWLFMSGPSRTRWTLQRGTSLMNYTASAM